MRTLTAVEAGFTQGLAAICCFSQETTLPHLFCLPSAPLYFWVCALLYTHHLLTITTNNKPSRSDHPAIG